MKYLGAHVSIAGGFERAIERGEELACTALQIFVKNPSQWRLRERDEEGFEAFRTARAGSTIGPVVAHATYLLNLCATNETTLERSRRCLGAELRRCDRLGLDGLVVHPGAHLGQGLESGIRGVAASLDLVLEDRPADGTPLLLECTAGQGTVIGHRLEHLEQIISATARSESLGICLDTCHLFAAGYPLDEPDGVEAVLSEVERRFGRDRIRCIHLNDSHQPRGSRKDRHANIGEGEIGEEAFARLLAHRMIADVPLLIETPVGEDGDGHRRDLELLRRLTA